MKLGISLQPVVPDGDHARVLNVSREVERLGFDAVYMSGHVLGEPGGTVMDPMTVLAAVAGATTTLRVATSVLLLPHYNPVLLANEAATLDVISGGRFVLAIGVGWNEAEFDALGIPFNERGARGDDHLQAMKALWENQPASYSGRFSSFENALIGTTPLTPGGPPIWVGGHSDAGLRRALRFGQAWHCTVASPDELAVTNARLTELGEEVGRDASTLDRNGIYLVVPPNAKSNGFTLGHMLGGETPSAESIVDDLGRLGEQGLTAINLLVAVTPDTLEDAIAWIAAEVLPKVSRA